MNDPLNIAIDLVNRKFADRTDRSGQPYVLHSLRVMLRSGDVDGRIVGMLHDVVEDSDVTLDDLRALGFPPHIIDAVDSVTRREGERYAAFIERTVAGGKLAMRVKLNDLADNLERVHELPEGSGLVKRYKRAKQRIEAAWSYE